MKKKWCLVILTIMILMAFAACGKKEEGTPSSEGQEEAAQADTAGNDSDGSAAGSYMKDLNAADYVVLGNYKGVEITLEKTEITDEYLDEYIDNMLAESPISIPVTDRGVEEGDTINIDYEGKFDGVAFERGTAQGDELTIGSGRFIPGFESGCIGMQVGETRDVEVTFPEPYTPNPDYAGKKAVFTVTVNSIYLQEIPELTDEYVQSLGLDECTTVAEYRDYIYDIVLQEQQDYYETQKADLAYEAVVAECEFEEAPESMVDRMNATLTGNLTNYADMYGVDLSTYVQVIYGATPDNYEEVLRQQSATMAQHYLMMQAIADREGLQISDEELEEELEKEAMAYGYATADEYREMIDVEAFREYLMTQKVLEFIGENAVVS